MPEVTMPQPIKIEPTEVEEAKSIRHDFIELTHRIGRIEFAKRTLDKERQGVETQYDALEKREASFIETLNKKYGVGQLNIETGEFTPATTE